MICWKLNQMTKKWHLPYKASVNQNITVLTRAQILPTQVFPRAGSALPTHHLDANISRSNKINYNERLLHMDFALFCSTLI